MTSVLAPDPSAVVPLGNRSEEVSASNSEDAQFNPILLGKYYSKLFPYRLLHSWLSYDTSYLQPKAANAIQSSSSRNLFSRREFSFTIEPTPGEEIYIRYQSFETETELAAAVNKRRPTKIDIGAIFTFCPKDHLALQGSSTRKFTTEQRELVFDVDLTDYDAVRKCGCSKANICGKCWKMMTMAMKVMDTGLREDFGFENIVWIYSGRRGVHAWVCDESARTLSNEGRSAVATYFQVALETDNNKNVSLTLPLHPMLSRAYNVLEPLFIRDILPASGHGLLATKESWTALLSTLPNAASAVVNTLIDHWDEDARSSPQKKWGEIKDCINKMLGKMDDNEEKKKKKLVILSSDDKHKLEQWPYETVFRYTYPRLDINVSKMQNHLLKAPFCVHPKTGRVCVPLNLQQIDDFDPFAVPTLQTLIKELDQYIEQDGETVDYEWQKTSLKEYFGHFNTSFLIPMLKTVRRSERSEKEHQASWEGDF